MPTHSKTNGFTLVEVMIVIAIIAIIFSVALPRYTAYTLRVNRTDAFEALNEIRQAQERFAAQNGRFTTDLRELGYNAITQLSEQGLYDISAQACGADPIALCVQLVATAQGSQVNDLNGGAVNVPITLDTRGNRGGWEEP